MESFERYAGFLPETDLVKIARDTPADGARYDRERPGFHLSADALYDAILPDVVEVPRADASPRSPAGIRIFARLVRAALPRRLAAHL